MTGPLRSGVGLTTNLAALVLLSTAFGTAAASAAQVQWRELTFRASNIAGSVTTQVHLETVPATAAAQALTEYPEHGASQPSGADVLVMTVRTALRMRFSKEKRYEGKVWLNPDGSALQRVRRSFGREPSEKTYRYGVGGVYRVRREPAAPQERDQAPQRWTHAHGAIYPYGSGAARCSLVSDPTGLLYLVSAFDPASLGPGLCAFNERRLYRVRIHSGAEERLRWHDPRRGAGEIETLVKRIEFRPELANGQGEPDDAFEFLGLEGRVEILRDTTSRLPIQVRGTAPDIGQVSINLVAVE